MDEDNTPTAPKRSVIKDSPFGIISLVMVLPVLVMMIPGMAVPNYPFTVGLNFETLRLALCPSFFIAEMTFGMIGLAKDRKKVFSILGITIIPGIVSFLSLAGSVIYTISMMLYCHPPACS